MGGQVFTKTLADFLGLELDDAEIVKIKYAKGGVGSGAKRKIENLFAPNISSWLGGVKVVLREFFKKYRAIPKQIFLCGGGGDLPEIKKVLEKEGGFQVISILPREIARIENKTRFQNIPCLALAHLALELPKDNLFSPTLKRVVRLTQE